MAAMSREPIVPVDRQLAARLYDRAKAGGWGLPLEDFAAALERSAAHRFKAERPTAREVEQFLATLHLEDLALAAACARGLEAAWNHFVGQYRPAVLAAARSCAPEDVARDLADSIYADLFGLESRDGVRRSLFDYFHGRSTLGGWLRAVLAQRVVDRARAGRRFEPLPDDPSNLRPSADCGAPDVDRVRYLALVRAALTAALAALAPRDRLRLKLYYARQMKLAAVGRMLGESEATASRKLERTRAEVRRTIERRLRDSENLSDAEIADCFEYARSDPGFDIARALPDGN
jgi:RNA polymerase sigma-70 factor, ECF subfamily